MMWTAMPHRPAGPALGDRFRRRRVAETAALSRRPAGPALGDPAWTAGGVPAGRNAGGDPASTAGGVPAGRNAGRKHRGHRRGLPVLALLLAGVPGAAAGQPPNEAAAAGPLGLGRAAAVDEIAALDIDVRPDGAGLPLGGGTAADGARVWGRACRSCHGPAGEGGIAAPLVGRDLAARPPTVGNYWPYATTLYDYIYRAMPGNAPGTLTADEVYGLVAWILESNGIIDDQAVMNAATLPEVVMPARDRFVADDRLEINAVR